MLPDFRKPKPKKQQNDEETWYDLEFDRVLIEQSIAKQYGVLPSEQGALKYSDWAKMVSGLMDDTPLGRVVAVRSEKDREMIRHMNKWQKQIRADWTAFRTSSRLQVDVTEAKKQMAALEKMLAGLFGGGK